MESHDSHQFAAALRHNHQWALRRLRVAPLDYLPLAIQEARGADPADVRLIARLLRRLIRNPKDRLTARLVLDSIPHGMELLAPVAIEAANLLLKRIRPASLEDQLARAELLNDLAERYPEVGERRLGLSAARRSVRILRTVATHSPDEAPRLALALQVLAKRLSDCGRHAEAIRVAEEAVDRTLALARDVPSLRRYVAALNTLSNRYGMAGNHKKALEPAKKAHALVSECAKQGTGIEEDLAHSFLNLATIFTHLEEFEQVIRVGLEAWERFQVLSHHDPDRFERMYLAANDLVVGARARLGLDDPSGPQIGESLALLSKRAEENLRAHLHRYMVYLVRHSGALAEEVASDEAVDYAEQAVSAARRVAQHHGNACATDEGNVHLHLAKLRASRGESEAARRAAAEAIERFLAAPSRSVTQDEWILEARSLAEGP